MSFLVRPLEGPREIEQAIALQARVWGLSPTDTMSPITLTALCHDHPRTGWLLGGFLEGRMVALAVMLATFEPGLVYGHMFGVLPELQGRGLGLRLMEQSLETARRQGARRAAWTFEPLEARNAHLYLNRLAGRAVAYHQSYYPPAGDAGLGLELDRFLCHLDLERPPGPSPQPEPLEQALAAWPVAVAGRVPRADTLLVEIPPDLTTLLAGDLEAARAWRRQTRAVLQECLGARGMVAEALHSGHVQGRRRSFYRLARP